MARLKFQGRLDLRIVSFAKLSGIAIVTWFRHLMGKEITEDWDWMTETGVRFWRQQFTKAMRQGDMAYGRAVFDSLLTMTDDRYDVVVTPDTDGTWITPANIETRITLLYFHGGGYTFNGPVSERFASMLAHRVGARVYMPIYRLTPEHSHPAQSEDAFSAWQRLNENTPAEEIVVIGDSAGGHMALMLLQDLKQLRMRQPALCIALCPWTDIGERGRSLFENDLYDLVQGWMAVQFGEWLDPDQAFGQEALSPISKNYAGLAPIYMQAGGREILRDMIIDFARVQADQGADIMLDVWDDMAHNFQAHDTEKQSSTEALQRIRTAVMEHGERRCVLKPDKRRTHTAHGCFSSHTPN